jgi:LytS/YehU family sensor histidine kinase
MSSNRKNIYWYSQAIGWSAYIILNSITDGLITRYSFLDYAVYFLMVPGGIFLSHMNRKFIQRNNIMSRPIPLQIAYILLSGVICGLLFFGLAWLLLNLFILKEFSFDIVWGTIYVFSFSVVFCVWNVIYLGFKYFEGYKRSEIETLKYLALSKESELNSLKAQLNPHFMFNCLNSIRALVDEDPERSKTAVTRLSNILRKTLQLDKNREIKLSEEMELVNDYLSLEKIRYEERLRVEMSIDPATYHYMIPPFIIQSQVENAVKHGIAKIPGGGEIRITIVSEETVLRISVFNTGRLNQAKPETGVGFMNSKQRLNLLYGEKGSIRLTELSDGINVDIKIPIVRQPINETV